MIDPCRAGGPVLLGLHRLVPRTEAAAGEAAMVPELSLPFERRASVRAGNVVFFPGSTARGPVRKAVESSAGGAVLPFERMRRA